MPAISVSIIVPCYNYAHFLGEALGSVLAQTYQNWECIIINDGSSDNTVEVAQKYCDQDFRFKYFFKENGGHSSARNFGIRKSVGKYILPLDADDTIAGKYLEKAIEKIESDPNIKIVTGRVQNFGDMHTEFSMPFYNLKSYLIVNYLPISSLFSREDFDKANGFDETMLAFEDWDLFIKILKNGGLVVELPLTGLNYRKKNDSLFSKARADKKRLFKDLLKLYNNNIDIYEKYFENPIHLIQENEKLMKVIDAYQKSLNYRIGLKTRKLKAAVFGMLSRKAAK